MITTSDRRFPDRHVGSNHDPLVTTVITLPGSEPVDLTDVTATISARNRDTGTLVIDDAEATGSAAGVFSYVPTLEDFAEAGEYQCQIKLVFDDDTVHYSLLIDLRILANL